MSIKDFIKNNEKTYNGVKDIKYLFCEGENSNKLIVTFPGFPGIKGVPEYNYIRTLKDSKHHKLYILDDFGPRGSYLIGENGDNSIETSVISLISNLCEKYDIKSENVILQGSSKGGYCALYYGIKYELGYVIAGGPQTRLGSYLKYVAPEVTEFITGGREEGNVNSLDNLLFDLLDSKIIPKIFIHTGIGDHHYKEHIIPFIQELQKREIEYNLNIANYSSHSSVGVYYKDYLVKTLHSIDEGINEIKPVIHDLKIEFNNNLLEITCNAEGEDLEYDCYIFKPGELIERLVSQKESKFNYPISDKGIYSATICANDPQNNINCDYTSEIHVIDKTLPIIHDVSIEYKKRSLRITCKAEGQTLEYACYILCEGQIIKKIMYQKDNVFQYPIKSEGTYRAILFAKNHENSINTRNTDIIHVTDFVPQKKIFDCFRKLIIKN